MQTVVQGASRFSLAAFAASILFGSLLVNGPTRSLAAGPGCFPVDETGQVAHWKLDEGSGMTTADSAGADNTGTLENGPGWIAGNATVASPNPAALSFDGVDDQVRIADSQDLQFGTGSFTVTTFVKTGTGDHAVLGNFDGVDRGWGLYLYSNSDVYFFAYGTYGKVETFDNAAGLLDDQWHHLAGVFTHSGAQLTIDTYMDGVLLGSTGGLVGDITSMSDVLLGNYLFLPHYEGALDDVRVFHRVLDATEIANLADGCSSTTGASSSSSSALPTCTPTDANLTGYWTMDEGSGSIANDSTTPNNVGTLSGATWTNAAAPLSFNNPSALSFDGTDDKVTVASSQDFAFGTGSFTVSLQAKTGSGNRAVLGNFNGMNRGWGLYLYSTPEVYFFAYGTHGKVETFDAAPGLLDDQWHHIAGVFTRSGSQLQISTYVDGTLLGITTGTVGDITAATDLLFGKYLNLPFYDGSLDDVRIYDSALNGTQVASLASGNCNAFAVPPPCAPTDPNLIGYWKFDEGTGSTTADSAGGENNGTLDNQPTWVSGNPAVSPNPSALSFDGVDDQVRVFLSQHFEFDNEPFTVSTFLKTGTGGSAVLGNYNGFARGWGMRVNTGSQIAFFGYGTQGTLDTYISAPGLLNDQWHHVAAVYTRSGPVLTIDTYLDGSLIGTATGTVGSIESSSLLLFGRYLSMPYFEGLMDDIRVYDSALTATQVAAIAGGACSVQPVASSSSVVSSSSSSVSSVPAVPSSSSAAAAALFQGLSTPEPVGDNGAYRGSKTNILGGVINFLAGTILGNGDDTNAPRGAFGGVAPGAFGGGPTVPWTPIEIDMICSMRRAMPVSFNLSLIEATAKMMAPVMNRDEETVLEALRDSSLCPQEVSAAAPVTERIPFEVSAAGYPLSSNPTWNACVAGRVSPDVIRNNPDKDEDGLSRDCSFYHTGNLWKHPDHLMMYFQWDRKTKHISLPEGYVIRQEQVVTDAQG